MRYELFVYPPYNEPLLSAFGCAYESVFVVLHPFLRVPDALAWKTTKKYPDDSEILAHASRCPWTEVAARAGLANCSRLGHALLTSIGALGPELADPAARDTLKEFLVAEPIWMPTEGRFEPLLQSAFLSAFEAVGHAQLVHVPEFPGVDPIRTLSVASLRSGQQTFPAGGTLAAPDASFLFSVDWESFFTLFYGPRAFVEEVARQQNLEGFFATPTTEHYWFNYVLGCATVTVTPEVWTAATSPDAPASAR
ncbi:MAG: DUF2711 family protein [Terracidiphilus sp.]